LCQLVEQLGFDGPLRHIVLFLKLPQVSLINFVASLAGAGGIQAFKTMRTLRALRPLRAMSRMQGMRVCKDLRSFPALEEGGV